MRSYEQIHPFNHNMVVNHQLNLTKEAIRDGTGDVNIDNVSDGHKVAFYLGKALYELCSPKLREGRKYLGDDTSWIDWKVLDPDSPEALAIEAEMREDDDYGAVYIQSAYDCTGKVFSGPIRVKKTKTRFLVSRFSGIDV